MLRLYFNSHDAFVPLTSGSEPVVAGKQTYLTGEGEPNKASALGFFFNRAAFVTAKMMTVVTDGPLLSVVD